MAVDLWPHRFSVRVYYEDTDAGGVVYHTSYLRFAERARTELLRTRGLDHQQLRQAHGGAIVVAGLSARYRAPARLDDLLTIETRLQAASPARLTLAQRVALAHPTLVDLTVELAFLGTNGRPRRFPAGLLG